MLFLFDDDPLHHRFAKRVLDPHNKYKINMKRMEKWNRMQFNYGLANPPYQSSNKTSLWPEFFIKLHELVTDGYGIIVPNRLGGSQPNIRNTRIFDKIKSELIIANVGECSKHFPGIGKGTDYFSYYIVDKRQKSHKCHFISRVDDFYIDPTKIEVYPTNTLSLIDLNIFAKIKTYPHKFKFKRKDDDYISDGNKRFLIKNPPNAVYSTCYKYFDDGTLSNMEKLSSNFFTYHSINNATEESAFAILNGKLATYYIEKNTINSIQVAWLNDLPRFDLTRVMSDEDQCIEIGLTPQEIKHVLNYNRTTIVHNKQLLETDKSNTVRTDDRIKQTGEVFTPSELTNEIIDQFPKESLQPNKTFIDPASGNGNLLVEILKRKIEEGHNPSDAIKTIYGVDIMSDNVKECKQRLLQIVGESESNRKTLDQNIKQGNTLKFCFNALGNNPLIEF